MKVLIKHNVEELIIKKSRFKSELFPIHTQNEARLLLKLQKEKYRDSNHVVHAFVIGNSGEILGCSDDGEPSGTAGKPALAVLKGSNITDVLLTITRWFGGVLLGTGGLVKAYSDSAKSVLATAAIEEFVLKESFTLKCSYQFYKFFQHIISDFLLEDVSVDFSETVKITAKIPASKKQSFQLFLEAKQNRYGFGSIEVTY